MKPIAGIFVDRLGNIRRENIPGSAYSWEARLLSFQDLFLVQITKKHKILCLASENNKVLKIPLRKIPRSDTYATSNCDFTVVEAWAMT